MHSQSGDAWMKIMGIGDQNVRKKGKKGKGDSEKGWEEFNKSVLALSFNNYKFQKLIQLEISIYWNFNINQHEK